MLTREGQSTYYINQQAIRRKDVHDIFLGTDLRPRAKTLLGKVKTNNLETASRASQETEENNRDERIGAYLALLSRAAQHFIDALVMVNNAYGKPINAPKGVWFEFEDEIKVDKTRAERDKMYMDTGQLLLTETYYRDILGFEPEHFELRDPKASSENPAPAKFSLRLSDGLARNAPDTAEQTISSIKVKISYQC